MRRHTRDYMDEAAFALHMPYGASHPPSRKALHLKRSVKEAMRFLREQKKISHFAVMRTVPHRLWLQCRRDLMPPPTQLTGRRAHLVVPMELEKIILSECRGGDHARPWDSPIDSVLADHLIDFIAIFVDRHVCRTGLLAPGFRGRIAETVEFYDAAKKTSAWDGAPVRRGKTLGIWGPPTLQSV